MKYDTIHSYCEATGKKVTIHIYSLSKLLRRYAIKKKVKKVVKRGK